MVLGPWGLCLAAFALQLLKLGVPLLNQEQDSALVSAAGERCVELVCCHIFTEPSARQCALMQLAALACFQPPWQSGAVSPLTRQPCLLWAMDAASLCCVYSRVADGPAGHPGARHACDRHPVMLSKLVPVPVTLSVLAVDDSPHTAAVVTIDVSGSLRHAGFAKGS